MHKFISDFTSSSYYKQIITTYPEVVAAYIGGSRVYGLENEHSDYDITVIVNEDSAFYNPIGQHYLTYKGTTVHWYFLTVNQLLSEDYIDIYEYLGRLTLCQVNKNNTFIYKNPKYENLLTFLLVKCDTLAKIWSTRIFQESPQKIEKLIKAVNQEYTSKDYKFIKRTYFLMLASYWLLQDELDYDFLYNLNQADHVCYLSQEYKQKIADRLIVCNNYLAEQDSLRVTEIYSNILEQLQELV